MASAKYDFVRMARAEAQSVWRRQWVYVGLSTELAEPGQILPFTLPETGLHIERMPDGTAEARLNRAQQGGCFVIPQQCDRGTQIRCSQTACAFSRDNLPVITPTTPDLERLLFQFKGNRPDLLSAVEMREEGGVIAVRLRPLDDASKEDQIGVRPNLFALPPAQGIFWHEIRADWKVVAHHFAACAEHSPETIELPRFKSTLFHGPNAITLQGDNWGGFVVLQPLAHKLTRCRISLLAPTACGLEQYRKAFVSAIDRVERAAGADAVRVSQVEAGERAVCLVDEPGRSLFARSAELGNASATTGRNGYRLNPRFGFVGG